ncbi:glycosyltransferase family 4 protein [Paludisphaera borealis]|uniref:glycosyltransferase family 4 protein n=1 Tax=Paludisphaera borealis TaxID=1387353 RepID=UPI001F3F8C3A|nr:glycosyltransferase family 4 protein [Paludisphaera borealis]
MRHDDEFASVERPTTPAEAANVAGKRLLFINQYYWPDHASTAQHLTDLAESLAARGFECHVLCSQSRYKPGDPVSPAFEIHQGVHIHRVPATSMGRKSTLSRMTDYLSFYARAVVKAMRLPRFDAVVTLTTPPIIGLVGTLLRRFKGTTHVCWSMDLHPDASLALKRMSPRNPIVKGLAWLSDFVLRQADRVVVLGPYMADRILMKKVRPDRVTTIPVWSRRDEVYPVAHASNALRKRLGFRDELVAMYSGNLGLAHTFDEFIEAARRLRDRSDIVFLYVGGGPRLAEVRAAKEAETLDNIRILDYVAREELHLSLSTADVHLISMRPEMTGIVVPGKLYGIMAAARPSLFVGPQHCESADLIRRSGGGFAVSYGDADGVVFALEKLSRDRNLARQMGEKGRQAFLTMHEMGPCCFQWLELMRSLVGTPKPAPRPAAAPSLATVMTQVGRLQAQARS